MFGKKKKVQKDLISVQESEFSEMTKAKKFEDDEMFFFKCECGNIHMRHAGYIETLVPFIKANKQKEVNKTSYQVHVCTKCRKSYIWYDSQMYDVSDKIDIKAWQKAEVELNEATGPGGEC